MCVLSPEQNPVVPEEAISEDWPRNYFNYFTEIEDRFQQARGTGLFLLSPLDWALIDSWRTAGVPLEAVLRGIDEAFAKWHSRKQKRRLVNSLAYCAQAVLEAAQRSPAKRPSQGAGVEPLFDEKQIAGHLSQAAVAILALGEPRLLDIASQLEALAAEATAHLGDLESLEQRLTALEEKLVATLRVNQSDDALLSIRQSLAADLRPYRSKMTADQLATLERRYLDSALLERAQIPRLSLFYLR